MPCAALKHKGLADYSLGNGCAEATRRKVWESKAQGMASNGAGRKAGDFDYAG